MAQDMVRVDKAKQLFASYAAYIQAEEHGTWVSRFRIGPQPHAQGVCPACHLQKPFPH